jgi:hypothetical protein
MDFGEMWQMLGSGFNAGAKIESGYQASAADNLAATGADVAGGQAMAAGTVAAQNMQRRTKLLQSRAQAVAAASGAGASDPTVTDIVANIAGEGAYRSMLDLYDGAEQQRAMNTKADALRYQGKSAVTAGYLNAASSWANSSFGKTFFEKYANGGANPTPATSGSGAWDNTDYGSGQPYNYAGAGP